MLSYETLLEISRREKKRGKREGKERLSTLYLNHNLVTANLLVSIIKCLEDIMVSQHKIFPNRTILLTTWLLAAGGDVLEGFGTFGIRSLAGRSRNTSVQLNKVVTVPRFSAKSLLPNNLGYNSSPTSLHHTDGVSLP